MPITVFGSIIVDLIVAVPVLPRVGETSVGAGLTAAPGGKGANQALAARRAGAEVHLAGAVGDDPFARQALAGLARAGVDLSLVAVAGEPTGIAAIGVDQAGENQILLALGANLAADPEHIPDRLLGPGHWLVIQGELPLDRSLAAASRARALGGRVCLNLAPAQPWPDRLAGALDLLVVNEAEAAALGIDPAAPALADAPDCAVIVTLGAAGAVWSDGQSAGRVPAPAVSVVDTIGAGDAFVGALVAACDRGLGLPDAVRRAVVAGSLSCQRAGAQSALPDAAEIERALRA